MRAARLLVALGVAGVGLALAVGLSQSAPRVAGTNSLRPDAYVATIPAGERLCQRGEALPADAGAVEVNAGAYGRPGPVLAVTVGPRVAGRSPAGYRDGAVRVPLRRTDPRDARTVGAEVCVENRGRSRVALAGSLISPKFAARVEDEPAAGRITLRWLRSGEESWWGMAATIAERATFGKADLGPWAPVVLLAIVWAGAVALVLRRQPA